MLGPDTIRIPYGDKITTLIGFATSMSHYGRVEPDPHADPPRLGEAGEVSIIVRLSGDPAKAIAISDRDAPGNWIRAAAEEIRASFNIKGPFTDTDGLTSASLRVPLPDEIAAIIARHWKGGE